MQPRNVPHSHSQRDQRGFTLVEIMVVVVIIGLLATLVTGNILESADEARLTKARADCAQIYDQARLYSLHNAGRLPEMEDLVTPDEEGRVMLEMDPLDPWDNEYLIVRDESGRRSRFFVISMGPDGIEDTDDDIIHPDRRDDQ